MSDFDPRHLVWVLSTHDVERLCAIVAVKDEAVIDLETSGLNEHAPDAAVAMLQVTVEPGDTWVVPLAHPDSPLRMGWRDTLRTFAQALVSGRTGVIGQNVKFDCRWIYATTGVDLSRLIVWDTRMSSSLLDENSPASLKNRAADTFGIERWDEAVDFSRPGAAMNADIMDLGEYGARDTYWTWRLADLHRDLMFVGEDVGPGPMTSEEVADARLGLLARFVSMPTVMTLSAIEQRGIALDREWVQRRLEHNEGKAAALFDALSRRYDRESLPPENANFAPTALWFREWTRVAVEEGDLRVVQMTGGGRPSWGKSVLGRLSRQGNVLATDLLEYRRLVKQNEYLRAWLDYADNEHGRIHTTYNAGSVVTGRLSSSEPNMQQVTASLKPSFVPSPGYVFADLDYSQIELRVAAHVSQCRPMIEAFQRGDDLHTLLAARITHQPPEDVTPAERQKGKSANFGLLYGMSAYGFRLYAEDAYGVVMDDEEAALVHRTFFEMWEGMEAWHARAAMRCKHTSQIVSPLGRIRRLPEIHSADPKKVEYAARAAVNAPVQGMASDMMQIAAAWIEGTLPGHEAESVGGARIVGTVHDSILVEVAEDSWKDVTDECMDRMLSVPTVMKRMGCDFDVPLAVEAKVGTRWGLSDVGTAG